MTTSSQIRLAAYPVGEPGDDAYESVTVELPELEEGQVLLRTIYLSLDPYMRSRMSTAKSYAAPVAIGDVMVGATVSEVVESRAPERAVGDVVLADAGWQSYAVVDGRRTRRIDPAAAPVSTALGVLGMPGFTAYAGMRVIGRPKPGETVVVAAATGPVGSAVGQIAKIDGARAVGIAGGAEKRRVLLEQLGFDAAVDHRSSTFVDDLAEATPDGIDVYFENVGGHVTEAVLDRLNRFARVPVCGLAAWYNATSVPEGPDRFPGFMRRILTKSLTVRGFIQDEFAPTHHAPFFEDMPRWLREGKIRYQEDVVEGLENAPAALRGLLNGAFTGKLLIQVGDLPPTLG
ncbi:NADP-dependent oxidoreductase [Amycolatopsis pithecellobii]|uniref:Zinc-binding dehydrogenase n=1 Tax=Amycolatopsis pithecellobii TaxID=664692 RepID=A0A6N7ZCH5_9PSEU|nr:NADP-dependent oxidoreductase [Amycolatopsis pithecellobii]MTD59379.1 zinc-binding dehydrogenase [Amycolatopsis pithecellobii]